MILVVNFGGQYAHLIARRIRDLGARSEIVYWRDAQTTVDETRPSGIVLSGSPASVLASDGPQLDARFFESGIPILGICYGIQMIAHIFGGSVEHGKAGEYGRELLSLTAYDPLFEGLEPKESVWMSHGDQVAVLPAQWRRLGATRTCPYAAMRHPDLPLYGVQFHPEVVQTEKGERIFSNFVFGICRAPRDWRLPDIKSDIIQAMRSRVGPDAHAMVAVSGGVDSLVAAALMRAAVGDRLHCVFVDTGLLRKGEARETEEFFRSAGFHNFHALDANALFLDRLRNTVDPEGKRRVIGHAFADVFREWMGRAPQPCRFFVQGTTYPDRVESGAVKGAAVIKSHHNLVIPADFGFEIIEPLKDLYKDEVRRIGIFLGLPRERVWRHPSPGPGLAIRIVGRAVTPELCAIVRSADAIYTEELLRSGEYARIWQAFAALLPGSAVGVRGDDRHEGYIIVLRAVDATDGMTADWYRMPYDVLERAASRITREIPSVARVMYDVTSKPPATIEYE